MPEFDDLKPWPDEAIDRHHNQPPLAERIVIEFDDALRLNGLTERLDEIARSAARAPDVDSPEACGKAGDLVAMARAVKERVGAERDALNAPLTEAAKALKGKADALLAPMETAIAGVQASLDAFMADRPDKVRGDYGALVSAKTQWRAEIVDFAKLPKEIRQHDEVIAAALKVVRARVRGGERKISGARIWPETTAAVR